MFGPRARWLAVAAATLVVGALLPGSALADTTPGGIAGHLLDGTTPVANATVNVIDADFAFVGQATTDTSGAFAVGDLQPGDFIVEFRLPGGMFQYSRSKPTFDEADRVTVAPGATTPLEEIVVPHGSIGGTLTDATGTPVANADVQVVGMPAFLSTSTDGSGHYSIPFVPPATFQVSFRDPTTGITQVAHGKGSFELGDSFVVTPGSSLTVDEQLVAPGIFTGRVTTADGLPAAFVAIDATSPVASQFAFTDADGNYTMKVFPGSYKLSFSVGPGLQQWAHQQRKFTTAATFSVASGGTTVVDEQFLATGTLAGRLLDNNGRPVDFGLVTIESEGVLSSTTIFNGNWQANVFPGTYRVSFQPISSSVGGTQWATGKSSPAAADRFTVQAGQTTRVDDTLAAPGSLSLSVRDSVTGELVPSYCVTGLGFGGCTETGTMAFTNLLPGDREFSVFPRDSHLAVDGHATIVSGQTTTVALVSEVGATIRTTVRDAKTGATVAGICVYTVELASPSAATGGVGGCTDASGAVTISPLRPGSYNLFAFSRNGIHGHQWVGAAGGTGLKEEAAVFTVATAQTITAPDVRMDKAGTLTGIVRDKATGAPINGAIASWGTSTAGLGGSNADVSTDSFGRYTFTNLGPYEWPIFYHKDGYASEWSGNTGDRTQAKPIKIKAGKTKTHNEVLSTGVTLTGRVTLSSGLPIGDFGARVTLFSTSGDEIGSNDTGADGTYTLHALPRQSVTLTAETFVEGHLVVSAPVIQIRRPGPITINLQFP